jgi:amino acid adenylation domain-containing protein
MTTDELLNELRALNARVWVEGDQLRMSAPKGAVSQDLLAVLSDRKGEIVGRLAALAALPPLERAVHGDAAPLSFGQLRLWFLEQLHPGMSSYNIAGAVRLRGPLRLASLREAIAALVARHASLRTTIAVRDGEPQQVVGPAGSIDLPVVDLSAMSDGERESAVSARASAEAQRPIDLATGPLFRPVLYRLGVDDHVLVVVTHHIVSDGWSLGVLVRELGACYRASDQGLPARLDDLPIEYADYAVWQRRCFASGVYGPALSYWRRQLAGFSPLELPADRPRPIVPTFSAGRYEFSVPAAVVDRLNALSRAEGVTLYMTLVAAFAQLLTRCSGQDDVVVGTPVAGRGPAETEGVVGLFVNTLVLRIDTSGGGSFRQLLGRVAQTCLDGYAHQDLPFEKLVEDLRPQREAGRNPIFEVMFALQNMPRESLVLEGLVLSPFTLEPRSAPLDLALFVQEDESGLTALFEYATDLFDVTTIERMASRWRRLLDSVATNPDVAVGEIPLLSDAEGAQLAAWNETSMAYPADCGVHALVEAQVARTPTAVAARDDAGVVTYAELNARANQLARRLRALGVGRGDRVGICLDRSVSLPVAVLGVAKAGAAYVPLDPAYPAERLAFMLADADVRAVVVEAATRELLTNGSTAARVDLTADAVALAEVEDSNVSGVSVPDDLAYVIYTSGSTGRPKGVEVPHRALVNFLTSMQREPGLTASDVLVAVTTLSFDIAGLEMWLPLMTGARIVVASRETATDGRRLAALLGRVGATVLQATPATWRLLLETGWAGQEDLRILCGGEALPRDLADRLLARGAAVWNLYGPTETTIWSAVWRVEPGAGPVRIGHPIANTQLHVLDDRQQPVPVGVVGELYIGGVGVALGYRGRPDLTAERFLADPFAGAPGARMYRTGDLVRRWTDGAVECLGRADQQVKIRGYRIELGEIEQVLREQAALREAVVTAAEVRPGDTRLVAFVVPEEPGAVDASRLRAQLSRLLPDYMVPVHYVELAALPLTPNGKVDRRALPRPNLEAVSMVAYVPPDGETETQVAAIWAEVLGVERVGRMDAFFDLGGHSLSAMQAVARVQSVRGVDVVVRTLFDNPTVAAFAAAVDAQLKRRIEPRRTGREEIVL